MVGHAVSCRTVGEIAIVTIDNPPVNSLSHAVRSALVEAFVEARHKPSIRAIVLRGAGRGFCAGGDVREFGTPAAAAAPALSLDVTDTPRGHVGEAIPMFTIYIERCSKIRIS
jgi:enoyl-CoA hydratase